MTDLYAPADHAQFVVEGTTYDTNGDGVLENVQPEHVEALKILGCTDTAPVAEVIGVRVEPTTPPPLPEGYDEDALRALIEENEDMKREIDGLKNANAALKDEAAKAREEASIAAGVEEQLRNRIQELEARAASGDTETGTESAGAASGASDSPGAGETSESPIKEVDGILVEDAEAFDAMEYNALKSWLSHHGVAASSNIKKADAIAACKARFAELTKDA